MAKKNTDTQGPRNKSARLVRPWPIDKGTKKPRKRAQCTISFFGFIFFLRRQIIPAAFSARQIQGHPALVSKKNGPSYCFRGPVSFASRTKNACACAIQKNRGTIGQKRGWHSLWLKIGAAFFRVLSRRTTRTAAAAVAEKNRRIRAKRRSRKGWARPSSFLLPGPLDEKKRRRAATKKDGGGNFLEAPHSASRQHKKER